MTAVSQPNQLPAEDWAVVRVTTKLLRDAATRLVEATAPPGSTGQHFLAAASAHAIDLSGFWASVESTPNPSSNKDRPRVREVALAVPGAGSTLVLFTSQPQSPSRAAELAAVIDHACNNAPNIALAQVLLRDDEQSLIPAYDAAAFTHLADLAYLKRPIPTRSELDNVLPSAIPWPDNITIERGPTLADADIIQALEASYHQTLDCPDLCGTRSTRDVLASHRATGRVDPRLWFLLRHQDNPAGMLMLNPCPDQDSIELVYLGIAAHLRGKQLAQQLLREGLRNLIGRQESMVHLAVDTRNHPAIRLYENFGFRSYASRIAMIRKLNQDH